MPSSRVSPESEGCSSPSLKYIRIFSPGEARDEGKQAVPNGVVGAQTNPLGNGSVRLLRFGKLLLGAESLVALYVGELQRQRLHPEHYHRGFVAGVDVIANPLLSRLPGPLSSPPAVPAANGPLSRKAAEIVLGNSRSRIGLSRAQAVHTGILTVLSLLPSRGDV